MRASLKLLLIGTTLALMSGSGMFALTNDTVSVPGNSMQSGTFSGGSSASSHDIAAVYRDASAADCPVGLKNYDDDDVLPVTFNAAALDLTGSGTSQNTDFCVTNFGPDPVDLAVTIPDIASLEIGACQATEQSAGDNSCTAGGTGEFSTTGSLDDVKFAITMVSQGTSSACFGGTPVAGANASHKIATSLAPGDSCRFYLTVSVNPALTNQQRLARQTDSALFDLIFTASDGTGGGPI